MLDELYNRQILATAARISHVGRLRDADASAFKQSKYCGSTITVDLKMHEGKITDFAQDVQACALGQAAASIVARHIIGASTQDLKMLHKTVVTMLQKGGAPPQGRFADFIMLQPVKEHKARQGSVLLVLDAVVDCITQIETLDEERSLRTGRQGVKSETHTKL